MWVRKSEAELEEDKRVWNRRRKNLLRPLVQAFFLETLLGFGHMIGCRDSFHGFYKGPVPLAQWPRTMVDRFPSFLLSVAVFFVLIYLLQLSNGPLLTGRNVYYLCPRCGRRQYRSHGRTCTCGAWCEPQDEWKYVEANTGAGRGTKIT
jgi:hypothetical protein